MASDGSFPISVMTVQEANRLEQGALTSLAGTALRGHATMAGMN